MLCKYRVEPLQNAAEINDFFRNLLVLNLRDTPDCTVLRSFGGDVADKSQCIYLGCSTEECPIAQARITFVANVAKIVEARAKEITDK